MGSKAIQAKGSKLYIGTGTGSLITITAISKAFKAEVSGNYSAGTVGDRVTLDGGDMVELTGLTATVLDINGSTSFVIDVDTRNFTTHTTGGSATPVVWTQIKELKDFKPSGSSISKQDKTNLDSVAKEYSPGLPDSGDLTASINYVSDDAGLVAARTAYSGGALKQFKLVAPNADTYSFQGFFSKFPTIPSGATDGLLLGDMTIQIDGAVTKTP